MRSLLISILMLLNMMPVAFAADDIVGDLSSSHIAVTTGFDGADLIVFGSMQQPADVIITIEGPMGQTTIRQKSRHLGFWINGDSFTFEDVPSYYVIATSAPLDTIASKETLTNHGFDINQKPFAIKRGEPDEADMFQKALINTATIHGLYREFPGGVHILSDRLFRATFTVPAFAPLGDYKVHITLLREGNVAAEETLPLSVNEEGLSATIFEIAHTDPFIYALTTLLIVIVIGGGSALFFQRMA